MVLQKSRGLLAPKRWCSIRHWRYDIWWYWERVLLCRSRANHNACFLVYSHSKQDEWCRTEGHDWWCSFEICQQEVFWYRNWDWACLSHVCHVERQWADIRQWWCARSAHAEDYQHRPQPPGVRHAGCRPGCVEDLQGQQYGYGCADL